MAHIVTFHAWPDPRIDPHDCDPGGPFSRMAWLRLIGPTGWLVWGTLAAQLHRAPHVVAWDLTDLALAHGLGRASAKNSALQRSLLRLVQFQLAAPHRDGCVRIRVTAPPVPAHYLQKMPTYVADLQADIFSAPAATVGR